MTGQEFNQTISSLKRIIDGIQEKLDNGHKAKVNALNVMKFDEFGYNLQNIKDEMIDAERWAVLQDRLGDNDEDWEYLEGHAMRGAVNNE